MKQIIDIQTYELIQTNELPDIKMTINTLLSKHVGVILIEIRSELGDNNLSLNHSKEYRNDMKDHLVKTLRALYQEYHESR
jgi:hypothetical protein